MHGNTIASMAGAGFMRVKPPGRDSENIGYNITLLGLFHVINEKIVPIVLYSLRSFCLRKSFPDLTKLLKMNLWPFGFKAS